MATTLGDETLSDPAAGTEGCSVETVGEGAIMELASGTVVYDYVNSRQRWTLSWPAAAAAEFATIQTQALIKTSQGFSPPDSATEYVVYVVPNSFRYESFEVGTNTPYFRVELAVEEVS